ncbi:unnamed protein product [Mucor circinelloides]
MMGADICIVYCLLTDCMQQPYYYDYIILFLSLFLFSPSLFYNPSFYLIFFCLQNYFQNSLTFTFNSQEPNFEPFTFLSTQTKQPIPSFSASLSHTHIHTHSLTIV